MTSSPEILGGQGPWVWPLYNYQRWASCGRRAGSLRRGMYAPGHSNDAADQRPVRGFPYDGEWALPRPLAAAAGALLGGTGAHFLERL